MFTRYLATVLASISLVVAACTGAAPTATPTPTRAPAPPATAPPTATAAPAQAPTPTRTATPSPAPITVDVTATDFKFDRTFLTVAPGQKVTLTLTNKGRFPHSLNFHGYDAQSRLTGPRLAAGESKTVELSFDQPGYYPFYCPVVPHENAGMVGALRVVGPSSGPPALKIQAPRPVAVIRGSPATVMVGVQVTNFELDQTNLGSPNNKAGTGHWHVLLDGKYVAATADLYTAVKEVAVGPHTLKVELHNNDHSPVNPPVEDAISFSVEAPPTPTPTTAPSPTPMLVPPAATPTPVPPTAAPLPSPSPAAAPPTAAPTATPSPTPTPTQPPTPTPTPTTTAAPRPGPTVQARIQGFAYSPNPLTVAAGTTVVWTNLDGAPHTVTSDTGKELDSPSLGQGQTYGHTFNQEGTFNYHCDIHPSMTARVTVGSSTAQSTGAQPTPGYQGY